ncbi:DNA repair protein Rad18, putative [Penicillium digitatum PHI26]|uniref:DNA repair protein Rad18, putative n=1 Tax=Penicillium digitatum (strain PHI26 / CECT 20796) TaxID=1170229 RepID=K9GUD0_PEND2|nr:DNA repair protein Rad18, putative [Penicillium digitatum PHI26]
MPSRKRVQVSADSDEESDRSNQPARKRQRTNSESSANSESSTSSRAVINTADSLLAVNDDALLDDEDELEFRQTQIIQEKYSHLIDEANVPAEHGILERVECYNFMCHDHFYVELGPLINFIVGKNGSGKSAILTAITLCLGGKASATNRGQSLKSFIKEGKENSTIIVRIKNQGDGAYLADDFGKTIIVERHFSRSGTSGFKIKSENGRIVSTKKGELDAITDYFSLQIENPMNVLSQDMARQFLSTSSPAEKYKFFVKGVQLEQLDNDYRLVEESLDLIEEKLRTSAQDVQVLQNRKELAKKKLDISDQHDYLRNRIRNIRGQMAWAQVEEQERMEISLTEQIVEADRKITEAESRLTRFDAAFDGVAAEETAAGEHSWRAAVAVNEAQEERDKIKEKLDAEMAGRHDLQAEQRQIREYLKAAESRIQETQQKVDDENQRLADVSDGGYARKQDECEQAANDASAAQREYEEHRQGAARLREDLETAERDFAETEGPLEQKHREIGQAENQLQNLTNEGGSRQSGFNVKMPALLKAIVQEKSWEATPVGPIGHYVTLLEPKWSSILERVFGGTLASFIVSSKNDMKLLFDIMRRVQCNCPIFIGSDGRLDTSAHEPDPQHNTVLRTLQIDNELVRRQLIINHGIEQMLLIEDVNEASAVLFDGARPRNVKRCYSIDPKDRRRGLHLSYSRAGEPSQAPVMGWTDGPRMKSDVALQINAQRDIIADLKRQQKDFEQSLATARSRVEASKQALLRHGRTEKDLQIQMQRKEDHAEGLRDALDKENAEDGRIDALQAALKEAEDEKQLNEGSYKDSEAAMKATLQTIKEIRRELSAKDSELATLREKLQVAESEQNLVKTKQTKILDEKNEAVGLIDQDKQTKAEIEARKEVVKARVVEYNEKANLVSSRVPVDEGETPGSLDKKLDKLSRDLARYNLELGSSREEIAADATRTAATYDRALQQLEQFSALSQALKDTLQNRKKRWEIFRSHISSRAKAQFTYLLSERSFRGRLLADHTNKLLDLQVEPDITKDDSTGRGAKTLSGGEKSFSQVCLLLSLWEAMGSPIRCLDEFDVYMDHINRKMAIDMLMVAARRSIGRQFILITPGSKTDITISADVRVKELAEPERGQTTLTFRR